MKEHWLIHKGVLYVGQDLWWHFEQIHGHERHEWIIDEIELGRHPASALHIENRWMSDRAVSMIDYYEMNRKVDEYRASPEGAAAEEAALEELKKRNG
jgi:hypothetical protein